MLSKKHKTQLATLKQCLVSGFLSSMNNHGKHSTKVLNLMIHFISYRQDKLTILSDFSDFNELNEFNVVISKGIIILLFLALIFVLVVWGLYPKYKIVQKMIFRQETLNLLKEKLEKKKEQLRKGNKSE